MKIFNINLIFNMQMHKNRIESILQEEGGMFACKKKLKVQIVFL